MFLIASRVLNTFQKVFSVLSLDLSRGITVYGSYSLPTCISFLKIFFNVYFLRERETYNVQAGEGQRERETQNPWEAPGSELLAQSPMQGSNPWTARS